MIQVTTGRSVASRDDNNISESMAIDPAAFRDQVELLSYVLVSNTFVLTIILLTCPVDTSNWPTLVDNLGGKSCVSLYKLLLKWHPVEFVPL